MIDVYFYILKTHAENVIDCGLKVSEWYSKELVIDGDLKKCISALLNPRDDMLLYRSKEHICLKLEIQPQYCFIADGFFNEGCNNETLNNLYIKTIQRADKYIFGGYRLPECLITSTVLSDQISSMDKGRNFPVLYENSEKLYIGNLLEEEKENSETINNVLLYYYYKRLTELGKLDKIEDFEKKLAVFFDKTTDRTFCIRIPEVEGV